jgi:phospholipid/cholesterol/gamma-HCH transport system ATP-binding protein
VSLTRQRQTALEHVSLDLSPGDHVYLLGTAQSGKTVLLKVLAGLLRPTQGEVLWDGTHVAKLSAYERQQRQAKLGFVFQSDALFDSLSVLENVALPLVNRRVMQAEARSQAARMLESLALSDVGSKSPAQLSGGMRKRVGLARALIASPEVLFADDPFAGLDPATSEQVAQALRKSSVGKTLVVAAPEPHAAFALSRWIILRQGRVVHDGSPNDRALDDAEEEAA